MDDIELLQRLTGLNWQVYIDVDEYDARRKFRRKHGYAPGAVVRWNNWVYVGPIEEDEEVQHHIR